MAKGITEILYFTASWCQPCKTYKPIVYDVTEDLAIPVLEIDVDNDRWSTDRWQIMSVPTLVVFGWDDAHPRGERSPWMYLPGAFPADKLREKLESLVG